MTKINSRILTIILVAILVVSSSGCMTYNVVEKTHQGHIENGVYVNDPPNYSYYWWLPLTVPADVVTSPVQLVVVGYFYLFMATGLGNPEGI